MKTKWSGVFPALTTQMKKDGALDLDATARHADALIASGVAGLIVLGSLGENQALHADEKRRVAEAMVKMVKGRVPVLSGVAETSTAEAAVYMRDGERLGLDGFMLMPGMLYKGDERETLAHFRTAARATGLPIMVDNNPISYGNDILPERFARLSDVKNLEALKESSGDVRRITDLHNAVGDRYALFTGVDHIELFGPPRAPGADSRNFVLCPGKAYDRSPCGTGTSAKLACLYAEGRLSAGQVWRQESITGSLLEGSVQEQRGHIIPTIRGTAFVIGDAQLLLDPADPCCWGISQR